MTSRKHPQSILPLIAILTFNASKWFCGNNDKDCISSSIVAGMIGLRINAKVDWLGLGMNAKAIVILVLIRVRLIGIWIYRRLGRIL